MHAIRVLEEDHDRIENLLERLAETNGSQDRARLSERLENELLVHTLAEDNIFLPHVEEAIEDSEKTTAEPPTRTNKRSESFWRTWTGRKLSTTGVRTYSMSFARPYRVR